MEPKRGPPGRLNGDNGRSSTLQHQDEPLRHDAMVATLYLAQIGLGPAFYDHLRDGGLGRSVPPALMETVAEPR